ncbi:hypothetical protein B0T25DRAFT_586247 [Lasiosphaeria hispida]|uniref:Uncharacterized protein n=1 Tax=Lasiosphaeria hispida TaxID=260671 RepID=A0AAJ0H5F3_9PEZI|nr:hypothetical protein B0T25DRAFT_586247 [Lasiosphaeria hispida]
MTKNLVNELTPAGVSEPRLLSAETPSHHLRDAGPNWNSAPWAVTTEPQQLSQQSEADLYSSSLCSRTTFSDARQPTQPLDRRLPNRSVGVVGQSLKPSHLSLNNTDAPFPIPEQQPKSFPLQPNTETRPCDSSASDDGKQSLDDSESEWGTEGEASTCGHYSTVPRDTVSPSIPRFCTSNAEAKRLLSWVIDLPPVAQEPLGVAPRAFPADAVGGSGAPSVHNTATPSTALSSRRVNYRWATSSGKRGLGPPGEDEDNNGEDSDRKRPRPVVGTLVASPTPERRYACPFQKIVGYGQPGPHCFMYSPNNLNGGAASFSRVKSHVPTNHDPELWCHHCWKFCSTKNSALNHQATAKCSAAPRSEYAMQDGQAEHLRKWIFRNGTGEEKWYTLVEYLFPGRSMLGPDGTMLFTPYYENPATVSLYLPAPSQDSFWGSEVSIRGSDTSSDVSQVNQGSTLTNGFMNGVAAEGTFIPRFDIPVTPNSSASLSPVEHNNEGQRGLAGFVVGGLPLLPNTGGSLASFPGPEDSTHTNGTPVSIAHASGSRNPAVLELRRNNAKLRSEQAQTRSELERCRQVIHDSLEYVDQLSELQESYAMDSSPEPSPRVLQFGSAVMGLRNSLAPS